MYIVQVGGLNDIGLNHQIFVDEISRVGVIRLNTTYLCRCQIHLIDLMHLEKSLHGLLIQQIQGIAPGRHNTGITQCLQAADDGRADHPAMAGDKDILVQLAGHTQFSVATGKSWPCSLSNA